jgi:hypothetical protein
VDREPVLHLLGAHQVARVAELLRSLFHGRLEFVPVGGFDLLQGRESFTSLLLQGSPFAAPDRVEHHVFPEERVAFDHEDRAPIQSLHRGGAELSEWGSRRG